MAVFHLGLMSQLRDATVAIAKTFFERTPLILTPDEAVKAFIDPDHVQKLIEVRELVGQVGSSAGTTSLTVESIGFSLPAYYSFVSAPPVILPLYMKSGLTPTCPDSIRAKINDWTEERLRIGMAFGTVIKGIEVLNDQAHDARAISIMIPVLPTIMADSDNREEAAIVKRAQRLSQNSRVPKLPRLSKYQKEVLRDASSIVSMAKLSAEAPIPRAKTGSMVIRGIERPVPAETRNLTCPFTGETSRAYFI